jgi:hypothetical protein
MNTISKSLLLAGLLVTGCRAVVVDKPAEPQATIIPSSPGPTYVWVGDSWAWDNRSHVYVVRPGYWTVPKKKKAVWVDGHWVKKRGGWKYVRGHWKQR